MYISTLCHLFNVPSLLYCTGIKVHSTSSHNLELSFLVNQYDDVIAVMRFV